MRRLPPQRLAIAVAMILGLAVGAAGIAQAVGGGSTPPPKPLAQAIYDAARAPDPQGISARIHFTNHLLPAGTLGEGNASPVLSGADGRLWIANDGRFRLELQSSVGDAQIVSDGRRFSLYDPTSNTAYTGALPAREPGQAKPPDHALTLAGVQKALGDLGRMWNLSGATPTNTAGQPSYTVRIAPKDDGGLLGAAEVAFDAVRGVPLRAAVYAQGEPDPVLELAATKISYGKIPASDLNATPPANARKIELNPPAGHDAQGRPLKATGLAAVQKQVAFTVSGPGSLAGLPRKQVQLVRFGERNGALVTYGQGLGAILVLQSEAGSRSHQTFGNLRLPQVNIDGVTGSELSTPLGTVLTFQRGGVGYIIAGSVPPLAAENAARGLK
jgi:outer membrane lipoprotein-sorting protein